MRILLPYFSFCVMLGFGKIFSESSLTLPSLFVYVASNTYCMYLVVLDWKCTATRDISLGGGEVYPDV
jgi:hypothetical protein